MGREGKRTEEKGGSVKRGKGTQIIKSKSGSSLIGRGRIGDEVLSDACAPVSISITQK